jgi:uncharacterized protein YndB with AHSA1/START domain
MDAKTPRLRISRVVQAPRHLVYRAFTVPDHFAAWWGPIGSSVVRSEIDFDVRTGGYQRWTEARATQPDAHVQVRIDLSEVADGRLLAGDMHVTGQLPDGFAPFTTRVRIEFHDEGDRRTRLEIRQWLPDDLTGPSEEGWRQAFSKLDDALNTEGVAWAG